MIWHTILKTAILAPSPHNVQPWKIKIIDDLRAELYIDSTRTLPKEDTTGSFIILTMGMFLEAIKILAAPEGHALKYELFHEPDWYAPAIIENKEPTLLPFARMELSPVNPVEPEYSQEIFAHRRTSRVSLRDELVSPKALDSLSAIADEWGHEFVLTTDAKQIETILARNTEALFEDLNLPDYHDEIVEWFRYSEKQSLKHPDGLDYRSMNTPRATFWLSAKAPWMTKIPVLKPILAKIYRRQLGTIPTIAALAGKFWKPADAIETGKFLMRFWLETAKHGLYIHPFGNLVTNRPAAEDIRKLLGVEEIWLIFKIGYSPEPPRSYRLPLEKVLIK